MSNNLLPNVWKLREEYKANTGEYPACAIMTQDTINQIIEQVFGGTQVIITGNAPEGRVLVGGPELAAHIISGGLDKT